MSVPVDLWRRNEKGYSEHPVASCTFAVTYFTNTMWNKTDVETTTDRYETKLVTAPR